MSKNTTSGGSGATGGSGGAKAARGAERAGFCADNLVLIVVGAHPRAEMHDRPVAYGLRQRILEGLSRRGVEGEEGSLTPLVVSDVWYLNDASLRHRPAVSVGAPGVNALSAYLGDKLPSAFVVDDTLMVQMDLELAEVMACCWGVDAAATGAAVQAFCDRYLDGFLEAALRQLAA